MLDLENNSILYIYGFKETNTKYGKTYLLAASTEGTLGDNTELDLYWSTTNINKYIEKVTTCYKKLDIHGIVAYGSLTGKPILVAKKVGEYISQTKNKCAAMEIVQRRNNTKEDTSILDKNLKLDTELEEIPDYIGVKGKPKLDSVVKEGDTITILGYRQTKASMLIKASIGDNTPEYYVATYWLCNIINSHVLENKNKFTVLAGPDKTAPNKHKFKTYVYK